MNKRFNNALKVLKSNRGSSVVTVIVAMLFISILGAALLFATYTGLVVKVTEREGKQNFYTAEESMEIIRAGFQHVANEELNNSYDEAYTFFSFYNSIVAGENASEDFEKVFANVYKQNILRFDFDDYQTTGRLFTGSNLNEDLTSFVYPDDVALDIREIIKYYNYVLTGTFELSYNNVKLPAGLVIELVEGSGVIIEEDKIIIEGLSVTQRDPITNISTTIVSDIVINVPDFAYSYSNTNISSVPDFAFIVEDKVTSLGVGDIMVDGSLYMGSFEGNTPSSVFTVSSGTVITGGDVTLNNLANLTLSPGTNFWANQINVTNASIDLNGNTYIYDDLILERNADVYVSGDYIGYGSSSTNPDQSSAILVNGTNSRLNLQSANSLTLAGRGFIGNININDTGEIVNNGTTTSESLAIRSNQRLYLVPIQMLDTTADSNPFVHGDNDIPTATLRTNYPIWSTFNAETYGLTESSVKSATYTLEGDNDITYYFFDFANNQENADNFFKDYFANAPESIEFYLNQYLDILSVSSSVTTADGYTFNRTSDNSIELLNQSAAVALNSNYANAYGNLVQTLTSNVSGALSTTTPYDHLIETDAIRAFTTEPGVYTFVDSADSTKIVAMLIIGGDADYTLFSNDYPDLRFVLGYDPTVGTPGAEDDGQGCDIIISGNFTGLIVTDGDVTIAEQSQLIANGDDVRSALLALGEGGVIMGDFVNFVSNESEANPLEDASWNLNEIIEYKDWTKK